MLYTLGSRIKIKISNQAPHIYNASKPAVESRGKLLMLCMPGIEPTSPLHTEQVPYQLSDIPLIFSTYQESDISKLDTLTVNIP